MTWRLAWTDRGARLSSLGQERHGRAGLIRVHGRQGRRMCGSVPSRARGGAGERIAWGSQGGLCARERARAQQSDKTGESLRRVRLELSRARRSCGVALGRPACARRMGGGREVTPCERTQARQPPRSLSGNRRSARRRVLGCVGLAKVGVRRWHRTAPTDAVTPVLFHAAGVWRTRAQPRAPAAHPTRSTAHPRSRPDLALRARCPGSKQPPRGRAAPRLAQPSWTCGSAGQTGSESLRSWAPALP